MKRLISRAFLIVLTLLALGMLAFGPRPIEPAPDGRTRIQYWEKWTGVEAEQMQRIVDAFNETVGKEKGIWVDYVSMSQIDRKTLVSTAAGVPPDVAGVWDNQVRQFAAMNALEDLGPYASERGLTRDYYKPVYYDGCTYRGRLYALPSTPAATALHWNKQVFLDHADALRAAGLDPNRPPRTLQELDAYAQAIDTWDEVGGRRIMKSAGYIPLEPGWFVNHTPLWFGGTVVDETGARLLFTSPESIAAFEWVRSYSERLGKQSMTEFRSGFGGFSSPQNPFLVGQVAMVQQGPWMANYIEKLAPSMNRWNVSNEDLRQEHLFGELYGGMKESEVAERLGPPDEVTPLPDGGEVRRWDAGIKKLFAMIVDGELKAFHSELMPAEVRQKHSQWGAAPFPSAVPGLENVCYAGMDVLVIPRGAKHKKEAFEFIAFVSRQDQMERLCSMHSKNSPLREVSEEFIRNHPNPYIHVFEQLAASPNAHALPEIGNWPEVQDELGQAAQRVYLLDGPTEQILRQAQERAQEKLDRFIQRQEARYGDTEGNGGNL